MSIPKVAALLTAMCVAATGAAAKDIVDTAKEAGQFQMLLQAAQSAGMEKILKTPGPFTVFAPTDEAFKALPPGMVERLLKPENRPELAKILSYHVITGRLATGDVKGKNAEVKAANGQALVVNGEGDAVTVNGVKIVRPDMRADNGLVHVIDRVLLPPIPVQPRT